MTYLILLNDVNESLQTLKYIYFMPRNEGDLEQLTNNMSGALDDVLICRISQTILAKEFQITQAEVRPILMWALSMIFSRMAPIDHRWTLQHAFHDTIFENAFDIINNNNNNNILVKEPIAFLCPIIDMCNHSKYENVAVMVPEKTSIMHQPVICLRSLRDIEKGEELTMTYGGSATELKAIWGMQTVL